jgi:glycosyltransferase involved in cell wall biosynthesis
MNKILFYDFIYKEEGHYDVLFGIFNEYIDGMMEHIKIKTFKEMKGIIKRIYFLKKYLYKSKNDTIIATVAYLPLFFYSIIYKSFDYKLIIFNTPNKLLYRFIFSFLINRCKATAVLEDVVRENIYKKCRIKRNIQIIHDRNIKKTSFKKNNRVKKVLSIGAMHQSKDVSCVLNVINMRKYNQLQFMFYGRGINKIEFQNIHNNNVLLLDDYLDRERYEAEIIAADYVILPYKKSYGVRFSGILFESLNFGTPVIASDIFCLKKVVERYNCGIIYSDMVSLAEIFDKIQNDEIIINISDLLYNDFSQEKNKKLFQQFIDV